MAATTPETVLYAPRTLSTRSPLVIAHRGASGYRPEHTLAAYRLAIELGASHIEPDLVPTKDGVLVARHENNLLGTTDVAVRPEFADRRTTKVIDDVAVTGWFTEDFTLSELKTLRAIERLPMVRPGNVGYDGRFEVPTFDEVLQLAAEEGRRSGREIGVVPETKHPSYFASLGLPMESALVRSLEAFGLNRPDAPVIIQSFEIDNLRLLDRMTSVPIVQLVDLHQAERLTPSGLREISTYAEWVGPHKHFVLSDDAMVTEAHRAGLRVVAWTVRPENQFLAPRFRRGTDPNAAGDWRAEVGALVDSGVDGMFADYPDSVVDARDDWLR
jgi:glycerophosphoryl diester phosphodiesterase